MDRSETWAPSEVEALRSALDDAQRELRDERARVRTFRVAIAQHLGKGCRSQSLRTLLAEDDDRDSS